MNIISKEKSTWNAAGNFGCKMGLRLVSRLLSLVVIAFALVGCDFNGPWSYYPETREIYQGVYTYAYIVEGENPVACFSKMYDLEEASAENFAFYDSAYVIVEDLTNNDYATLRPSENDPNCFEVEGPLKISIASPTVVYKKSESEKDETTDNADSTKLVKPNRYANLLGVAGHEYKLNAFFKWDSSGNVVESNYSGVTRIPEKFGVKGFMVPLQDGGTRWVDYKGENERIEADFLTYPRDMDVYKISLEYESQMGGVVLTMSYDMNDNSESMETTINMMLDDFTNTDSLGYTGVAMHDPLERITNLGFESNVSLAGMNNLDTILVSNMTFPLGDFTLHFYATDKAYETYLNYVLAAIGDPRVIPESNIENGMGVFSGMTRVDVHMHLNGEGVPMGHIAFVECNQEREGYPDGWSSKSCRLYQDFYCAGLTNLDEDDDLYNLDDKIWSAYNYGYRDSKTCYPSNVKAAMMREERSWAVLLPDSISKEDKSEAYADGLKRYCVASNFESNSIADCSSMKELCLESLEKNSCNDYFWQWCSDRNWNVERYPQCSTALVSRYVIEEQQSPILEKFVDKWCKENKKSPLCKRK